MYMYDITIKEFTFPFFNHGNNDTHNMKQMHSLFYLYSWKYLSYIEPFYKALDFQKDVKTYFLRQNNLKRRWFLAK